MKSLSMAKALFASLGLVSRESGYSRCAVRNQSEFYDFYTDLLLEYTNSLCNQQLCIDTNLEGVSTTDCTVGSSPLMCLCSSANLEGDILDCMQDSCPDDIDFAGVSEFLDQFCLGLSIQLQSTWVLSF